MQHRLYISRNICTESRFVQKKTIEATTYRSRTSHLASIVDVTGQWPCIDLWRVGEIAILRLRDETLTLERRLFGCTGPALDVSAFHFLLLFTLIKSKPIKNPSSSFIYKPFDNKLGNKFFSFSSL